MLVLAGAAGTVHAQSPEQRAPPATPTSFSRWREPNIVGHAQMCRRGTALWLPLAAAWSSGEGRHTGRRDGLHRPPGRQRAWGYAGL